MTVPTALAVHELAHTVIAVGQVGEAEIRADHDGGFTTTAAPPSSATEAIDRHMAGVIGELLMKAAMNVAAARAAIEHAGWRVALNSEIGREDLALMGPIDQSLALQSFDRTAGLIVLGLQSVDVEAVRQAMERLDPGQSLHFREPTLQ